MSLGETIYKLRTEKNMSQGDLADALDVSRQSISKWETNSSVPELDKLIKLSAVFGVSLDELILNRRPQDAPSPQAIPAEVPAPGTSQKNAGIILLCFGALVWLMLTLLGDILSGLVFASPFIACGLICLFVRKSAGLWCGWAVFCIVDIYLRFMTGINWRFAFRAIQYSTGLTVQMIIAWGQLLCFVVLTVITVLRFRALPSASIRKTAVSAIAAWTAWGLSYLVLLIPDAVSAGNIAQSRLYQFGFSVAEWGRNALFVAAAVFTVRTVLLLMKKRN